MSEITVSAEWTLVTGPASESDQALLADALADGDPCVSVEESRPDVILASFDLTASDLHEGLAKGRESFLAAARTAGLTGSLRRLTAMNDEGYIDWPAKWLGASPQGD